MTKSNLRYAIILLTISTAIIHLYLNINTGRLDFQPAFTLNAIGYFGLMVAFFKWIDLPFLHGREKLVWYFYMGYAALTIVLYFVVNGALSFSNPVGLADKTIEVLLIAALWMHKEK